VPLKTGFSFGALVARTGRRRSAVALAVATLRALIVDVVELVSVLDSKLPERLGIILN
jgi:hypothetical protein